MACCWAPRVSDPAGGPDRLSGNGFGRIRLPCAKAHPHEAAFDITTSSRAAEPLGRPTVYLSPRAQDKVKALFPFSFFSQLQKSINNSTELQIQ